MDKKIDGDKYLDGIAAAKKLGVRIETPVPKFAEPKIDPTWESFDTI